MKVIAGKYRGIMLDALEGLATRPTLGRVKEAVFSSLGDIEGMTALDLFAGSGGIGVEMLSRGCRLVWFNDLAKVALKVIEGNLKRCKVPVGDYCLWNKTWQEVLVMAHQQAVKFDLVYLDPPFDKGYYQEVLKGLIDYQLIYESGRVVLESELHEAVGCEGYEVYKTAKYGRIKISYLRRHS